MVKLLCEVGGNLLGGVMTWFIIRMSSLNNEE